jgi:hypothetical protein
MVEVIVRNRNLRTICIFWSRLWNIELFLSRILCPSLTCVVQIFFLCQLTFSPLSCIDFPISIWWWSGFCLLRNSLGVKTLNARNLLNYEINTRVNQIRYTMSLQDIKKADTNTALHILWILIYTDAIYLQIWHINEKSTAWCYKHNTWDEWDWPRGV